MFLKIEFQIIDSEKKLSIVADSGLSEKQLSIVADGGLIQLVFDYFD